jgi:hypothetical protein
MNAPQGVAHDRCNLNFRQPSKKAVIPVYIHNSGGYDNNFILRNATRHHGEISVLGRSMKTFIALRIGRMYLI